jgi:hypothetical protein
MYHYNFSKLFITLSATAIIGLAVQSAAAMTFSDPGTFNLGTWTETITGDGDVIDTRNAVGGNPNDFLSLETIPSGGVIIQGVYINSAASWDPSTQGAISSIDMAIDVTLLDSKFGHADGQAYGIVILQDGMFFKTGFGLTGTANTFSSRQINGAMQADFIEHLLSGASGAAMPDFGGTGSEILFGLIVANSGGAPISGTTAGYDNWAITVNPTSPIPLPASLFLAIAPLSGLFWKVGWRCARQHRRS